LSCGLGNEGLSVTKQSMLTNPIPLINSTNKEIAENIEKTVRKINNILSNNPDAETNTLEQEIDSLIYELYDLTYEEIQIVENS
jgi:site-specific DNA-methyltransferase (adenine-specific)